MGKNEINGVLGCRECGRRIPTRNNRINMACQEAGLCRSSHEASTTVCKECGQPLPKDKDIASFACRQVRMCRYCYDALFPENEHGPVTIMPEISEPLDCTNTSRWEWLDNFFGEDR